MEWVASDTTWKKNPCQTAPVCTVQVAVWDAGAVWKGVEKKKYLGPIAV
jgi:hypothetical protein